MRLGRDSQFASKFWLGVAFALGRVGHATVNVGLWGDSSDRHILSCFAGWLRGRAAAFSFFPLVSQRGLAFSGAVCTRRATVGGLVPSHLEAGAWLAMVCDGRRLGT